MLNADAYLAVRTDPEGHQTAQVWLKEEGEDYYLFLAEDATGGFEAHQLLRIQDAIWFLTNAAMMGQGVLRV